MRSRLVLALALLLVPTLTWGVLGNDDDVAQGDKHFDEQSYSPALAAYEKVLADSSRPVTERGHALVRAGECLRRLKRWDDAIARLTAGMKLVQGTIHEARATALRGAIALTMPHWYYKKGKQISRERWIQGGTYHYTYYDDMISAMKDLQEGARLFAPYLEVGLLKPGAELTARVNDYAQICGQMASAIEGHRAQKGGFVGIDPHPDVQKDWAKHGIGSVFPADPQAWYAAAEKMALTHGVRDAAARARYMDAMYCRRLLDAMSVHRTVWNDDGCKVVIRRGGTDEEPVTVVLPDASNPFRRFPALIDDYAGTDVIDDAVYAFGTLCNQRGHFTKALEVVKDFDERFRESVWRSDVRALVQDIVYPQLDLTDGAATLPGTRPEISLKLRNMKSIEFRTYKIDLGELYRSGEYLRDAKNSLSATERFARMLRLDRLRRNRAAPDKTVKTPDTGKHRHHEMKVELDVDQAGAYLVEARGGDVTWRTIVCISELSIVRKMTPDETIVFVANARTGDPIEKARVLVRQKHRARGIFGRYDKITYDIGDTDGTGVYARAHEDSANYNLNIEAFAEHDGQYAMTSFQGTRPRRSSSSTVLYGFTDRPVYRPGQPVQWVGNLRQRTDMSYENFAGELVTVRVVDAKRNKIFEEALETDEFGAIHARIDLGEEPPLGRYNIQYRKDNRYIGAHSFRVEEYKKPEFEVTVRGPDEQIRAGDRFDATLHAEYYSGGGVPDAKVVYRVFRMPHWSSFSRHEPYEYLYGRRADRVHRRGSGGGRELVTQGEATTDAKGDVRIQIDSGPWAEKYAKQDHRFFIEADVTDLSRRTISGAGRVLVTRRALAVNVSAQRGFYRAGETVQVELRCQTPDGRPQPSKGRVVIYRVTATKKGDEVTMHRDQVHVADAATDVKGLGFHDWVADAGGHYAITYVTQDRWNEPVTAELGLWVTAPDYRADDFQFKNIEIITDRREYRPGDVAYVMINCQFDDSAVFFTLEADREILSRDVFRTRGRTHVLAVPIKESYAPNVFIHVMMVKNGRFYQASRELFVPPLHKFVDIDVAFDKATYRPGETARVRLVSKNGAGEPVAAQVALSVMDKSITYIQEDTTTDIRRFFYGKRRTFHGNTRWNANTSNSLQFRFSGYKASTPTWKRYRRHGYPLGWGNDPVTSGAVWGQDKGDHYGGVKLDSKRGYVSGDDSAPEESEKELLEAASEAPSGGATAEARRSRGGRGRSNFAPAKKAKAPAPNADRFLGEAQGEDLEADADLRTNFSDLASWQPALRTGEDGAAEIEFVLPDSLTTWVATARGLTQDTRVGEARSEVRTTKNIQVRLQAPRFFTERDEIVLSGVVRNDFAEDVDVRATLDIKGGAVEIMNGAERRIRVDAKGEARVDWMVKVVDTGNVRVTMKAFSQRESDAMAMSFPAYCYGIDKVVTMIDDVRGAGDGDMEFTIDVPEQRNVSSSLLDVTLSPSIAASLLESLPYLVEFPYGCTEQTMSRFLPAAVVARTLKDLGMDLEEIGRKRQDLANRDELNARKLVPVYGSNRLSFIVKSGVKRLLSMQNGDGGFGWWSRDRSSMHLTSYVLYGLGVAKSAGHAIPDAAIKRAADFLEREVKESRSVHQAAYACFALTSVGRKPTSTLEKLVKERDKLTIQGKAQLAMSMKRSGEDALAKLIMKNLEDFVVVDERNQTCHWNTGSRWWYWYHDQIEGNAWVLQALGEIAPESRHAEPLARWLVYNRTGNRWKSTRDTATAVLALATWARNSGEFDPDYEVTVQYAGGPSQTIRVTKENMLSFANHVVLRGDAVMGGKHPLRVTKRGRGSLYVNARLSYFSKEDRITAAGHQLEVERQYFALTPIEKEVERNGKKVKVLDHERTRINDLSTVTSGQEVEVKLIVTSGNDYEYVILEDRKPAGFEPVALRSGGRYANGLCSNMELRDEKVVFFVTWMQEGRHEVAYRMRAEIPGTVNAMPCRVEAMYAPRIGGISDSFRVKVIDATR